MAKFQVGQRVTFRPTHNKHLELTGTINAVGHTVDIESDAANGSVSRIYSAHPQDVFPEGSVASVPNINTQEAPASNATPKKKKKQGQAKPKPAPKPTTEAQNETAKTE